MRGAGELPGLVAERDDIPVAMELAVLDAGMRVCVTCARAAGHTLVQLVGREYSAGLERAVFPVSFAHETVRPVRSAEVFRTVYGAIEAAHPGVMLTDGLAAARALRHFVGSDDLLRATLASAHAFSAEPALAVRRGRRCCHRVFVADRTAADRARRHALAAGRMIAFRTGQLVLRAIGLAAGAARSGVLGARRAAVDVTRRNAMISTEDVFADTARRRAVVARHVPFGA